MEGSSQESFSGILRDRSKIIVFLLSQPGHNIAGVQIKLILCMHKCDLYTCCEIHGCHGHVNDVLISDGNAVIKLDN